MYQPNKLEEYVTTSSLRIVNEDLHIRLSNELAKKYDKGDYKNVIDSYVLYIKQIKDLGLKYPGNANPIFYIYIVPDEDFIELLNFPNKNTKQGGKPVSSYDLDGFNNAYGVSQNLCDNVTSESSMSKEINTIHEFAHLVHSQFFHKNRYLREGFADALPLYTMDYEKHFDEHREFLKGLEQEQIFSVGELLEMEKNNNFRDYERIPKKICSFDLSYISSYLFVRGCMIKITSKYKVGRIEATQIFLEMIRNSNFTNEWLVFDIARTLGLPQEELLNGKVLQMVALESIFKF